MSSPTKRAKINNEEFNVIIDFKGSKAVNEKDKNFNFKALFDAICAGRRVTSQKFTLNAEIKLANGTIKTIEDCEYKLKSVSRDTGLFGVTYARVVPEGETTSQDDDDCQFSLVQVIDKETDNSVEIQHGDGHYMLYERGDMDFVHDETGEEVDVAEFSFKVVSEHGAPFVFKTPAQRLADKIRATGCDPASVALVALQEAQDARNGIIPTPKSPRA